MVPSQVLHKRSVKRLKCITNVKIQTPCAHIQMPTPNHVPEVPSHAYSFPPQPLSLPGVFHLQALKRAPISLGNSFPINSSPHFPCKLNILSFQLASPPSIHMDSWWDACNLRQAQNGPTILPKVELELMGPNQIGFWLQNHKK